MTKKKNASANLINKNMEIDTDNRFIFANLRKLINPLKMCDTCINEWTNFTAKEEKLCDECYKHKYLKNK